MTQHKIGNVIIPRILKAFILITKKNVKYVHVLFCVHGTKLMASCKYEYIYKLEM
jgi:hypothetical protein